MDSSRVKMRGFVVQQEAPAPQDAAPQAWLVNRRVIDEETNQPVMEGIFSNYNDDIIIEADEMTLVGRYDPARGPAQRLAIGDRLYVADGALHASGEPGPEGPAGPEGPSGASSSMFLYRFDSGTAAADPGAGRYRYNNAVMASVTRLYIDRLTEDGLDPTTLFKASQFDDEIIIQERGFAARYQVWKITTPAIDHTDWFEVPAVFVSQAGANFTNNQNVTFLLRTRGQQGPPGPWTQVTQAQYNALSPPDPYTLYVIIG